MSNILIGDTFNSRKFFKKKSDNFDYHEPLPSSLKKNSPQIYTKFIKIFIFTYNKIKNGDINSVLFIHFHCFH